MGWIGFPEARNFTPYKDLLLSMLEVLGDGEEKKPTAPDSRHGSSMALLLGRDLCEL